MSSLWTPDGERPVRPASAASRDAAPTDPDELTEEELAEHMAELRDQLAATPAYAVVANHCMAFFELAALHLSLQPPQLAEAQLAIDALGAVVEGLGDRLADAEGDLRTGLAQLRMAFVQIRAANLGNAAPPSE